MLQRVTQFAADSSCTSDGYCTNFPSVNASSANVQNLVQVVLGIFAVVAVLIIVIAGLNFVVAGGDPAKVAKARSTIVYALIGLVVAVTADAIVTLVIGRL